MSNFSFSFSNFFKLLLAEIKKTINVWKFLFKYVLILLHIKSAFKKIWHLAQGRVLDPCLGPFFVFEFFQTTSRRNLKKILNVWKFLFRFVLILLHIKSALKNFDIWPKAGSSTPALRHFPFSIFFKLLLAEI